MITAGDFPAFAMGGGEGDGDAATTFAPVATGATTFAAERKGDVEAATGAMTGVGLTTGETNTAVGAEVIGNFASLRDGPVQEVKDFCLVRPGGFGVVGCAVTTLFTGTGVEAITDIGMDVGIGVVEGIVGASTVVEDGVGIGVGVKVVAGVDVEAITGIDTGASSGVGATTDAAGKLVVEVADVEDGFAFGIVFNVELFVEVAIEDVEAKGGEAVLAGEPPAGGLFVESSFSFFDTSPVGVDLLFFCALRAGKCLSYEDLGGPAGVDELSIGGEEALTSGTEGEGVTGSVVGGGVGVGVG